MFTRGTQLFEICKTKIKFYHCKFSIKPTKLKLNWINNFNNNQNNDKHDTYKYINTFKKPTF